MPSCIFWIWIWTSNQGYQTNPDEADARRCDQVVFVSGRKPTNGDKVGPIFVKIAKTKLKCLSDTGTERDSRNRDCCFFLAVEPWGLVRTEDTLDAKGSVPAD